MCFTSPPFPRGPGLYLNLFSLLAVVLVYLAWVRACSWVDQDARQWKLNRQGWNLLMLSGGMLGLGLFWLLPWFPIAFAVLVLLVIAPLAAYVVRRNARAPETERVWTERHLRTLLNRHLKTNVPLPEPEPEHKIALLLKPQEEGQKAEPARIRKARELPGFDAAMQVLCHARERQATQIHLEPAREWTQVRFRIDGMLHAVDRLPRAQGESLLPVFKTLAELDLSERRKPQQGEFPLAINGRRSDVLLRSSGTLAGERGQLRLRERGQPVLTIDQLSPREKGREQLGRLLRHERGLLVLCGLPDTGRTTTGYACLREIQRHQRQVMSLEVETEQRLPQVDQLRLDAATQETSLAGLKRVFLRDAPGALLVDVPLDAEAVEFAYDKATDHFLMLVLPGEDALAGATQLLDLGLSANRLAKKLIGVVCQRLVRVLCPDCKVRYKPPADVLLKLNLPADRIKHLCRPPEETERVRDDAGLVQVCPTCQGLGYRGRTAIFELLVMTERIRELLRDGASLAVVRQEAVRAGMTPQEEEALQLVMEGTTSVTEMLGLLRTEAEPPLASPSESGSQLAATP